MAQQWLTAVKPEKVEQRRKKIVEQIIDWAYIHGGEPPMVSDWRHVRDPLFVEEYGAGWPSYLTVMRYSPDGTWDGMIELAGFEPRGRGRPAR